MYIIKMMDMLKKNPLMMLMHIVYIVVVLNSVSQGLMQRDYISMFLGANQKFFYGFVLVVLLYNVYHCLTDKKKAEKYSEEDMENEEAEEYENEEEEMEKFYN